MMPSSEETEWQERMEARFRALNKTNEHIKRVRDLMFQAAVEIIRRGCEHDKSKHEEVELGPLTELELLIAREGQAPFGSEKYEQQRMMLGQMLKHHYAKNSHHPEHYKNGVEGMDLFDVVEMLFDWIAASERGEASTVNLGAAFKRFKISPQLQSILENTADRLGYAR
jgi:hypothetical protein